MRWPGIKGGSGSDILWSDMQLVVLALLRIGNQRNVRTPRGNGKSLRDTLDTLDLLSETNSFSSTASSLRPVRRRG